MHTTLRHVAIYCECDFRGKMKPIIKEIAPMILAMVVVLVIVTYVPDVVLWVPRMFGNQ